MRFHPLKVTQIKQTIREAVAVTLQPENPELFAFTQGQYLTFKRDFDGTELRRSYSICVAPDSGVLQVGIKRVKGGTFSTWANEELRVGDVLHAMPPMGKFHAPLKPESSRHYLVFAGGSGITPILSLMRTVLANEPKARITLVYANQSVASIMFREEIEDLKNEHLGRLNVIHMLEQQGQDIELFTGRLDAAKCDALFTTWVDVPSADLAFICGPKPMMETIAAALETHGLDPGAIRYELFGSDQPGRAARPAPSTDVSAKVIAADVTLDGETRHLSLAAGKSLLEAAIDQGLDAPFACKAGVCSTCKARVTKGEVEMRSNHALEDYEVEDGFVLTCQSYCRAGPIAFDYDQH